MDRAHDVTGAGSFGELARRLGVEVGGDLDVDVDADVEHQREIARWVVYQRAWTHPELAQQLLAATVDEPQRALAVGVVLEMLERLPLEGTGPWIEAVPVPERATVLARARDVAVLRACTPTDATATLDEVATWSDWLQRRLAHETASVHVLTLLEAHGRTRRVRGRARERLVPAGRPRGGAPLDR